MTVQTLHNIIRRDVVTCHGDVSTRDAIRMMYEHQCSSIIIVDDGFPVGIWTEADSLKIDLLDLAQFDIVINKVMTLNPFTTSDDLSLDEAAVLLKKHRIRHLIVVDQNGKLTGVASQSDIIVHQDARYFLSMTPVSSVLPTKNTPRVQSSLMLDLVIKKCALKVSMPLSLITIVNL